MTKEHFQQQLNTTLSLYEHYKKQSFLLSVFRFISFIGMLSCLLIGYFENLSFLYVTSFILLVAFLTLVYFHQKIDYQKKYYETYGEVINQHLKRINFQWDEFEDNGYELDTNTQSMDLDVFGHHSLFQMLNITFTLQGKRKLAKTLNSHHFQYKELRKRQGAILELANFNDFILSLETYGKINKGKNEKVLIDFIDSLNKHISLMNPFIFLCPIIVLGSLICALFSIGIPYSYVICEVGVVVQLIMVFVFIGKHQSLFEPVTHLQKYLESYEVIFVNIQKQQFQSSLLQDIQKQMNEPYSAITGIKQLSQIAKWISYRQNILLCILFNALGLYDFILRNCYLHWLKTYGKHVEKWFDQLAELECLMSLSVLKMDGFDVCMPEIVEGNVLNFKQLKHPLIDSKKSVGNDFIMTKNINMITGSNMSGKTTFMRTVALNLILAYVGGFVFASQMQCSYFDILTSMRVTDNVEEGVSTFYGEILRIKTMIDYSQKNVPMICFIDEIFKGTNSLDRIAGARGTVEKLSLPHCFVFLTTHDFELCQIENINNYHFCEYYKENQIYFDYLIHEGRSQTTNGQFLLKQLGIL